MLNGIRDIIKSLLCRAIGWLEHRRLVHVDMKIDCHLQLQDEALPTSEGIVVQPNARPRLASDTPMRAVVPVAMFMYDSSLAAGETHSPCQASISRD